MSVLLQQPQMKLIKVHYHGYSILYYTQEAHIAFLSDIQYIYAVDNFDHTTNVAFVELINIKIESYSFGIDFSLSVDQTRIDLNDSSATSDQQLQPVINQKGSLKINMG